MKKKYWFTAIPASLAFVIIMLTTFIGGDVDTDADFDADGDEDVDGSAGTDEFLSDYLAGLGHPAATNYQFVRFMDASKDGSVLFVNLVSLQSGVVFSALLGLNSDLGIDETTSLSNFTMYPNPAHDHMRIEFKESITHDSVTMLEITGKEIESFDLHGETELHVSLVDYDPGKYYLVVVTETGSTTHKLLVR